MSHWTEDAESEADGSLVRPYTITRGRTAPRRGDLTLTTLVTTVDVDGNPPSTRVMEPEHRKILARCREPQAVAEVAAALDLPISVTKILIGDLLAVGRVRVKAPMTPGREGLDRTLLQAVRDGLKQL